METITDRMKEVMELYHVNTSETAEMMGVSPKYLLEVINRETEIDEFTIYKFCTTFHISIDWLKFGVGNMRTGIKTVPATPEEVELAKLVQTTYENNKMLKEITAYIRKEDDEANVMKKQVHDFINNVVADLFADMLLQPKGRGHIDKEFINDVINKMK